MGAQTLEVERLRARAREHKHQVRRHRKLAQLLTQEADRLEEALGIRVRIIDNTHRAEAHSVPNENGRTEEARSTR